MARLKNSENLGRRTGGTLKFARSTKVRSAPVKMQVNEMKVVAATRGVLQEIVSMTVRHATRRAPAQRFFPRARC